MNIENTKRLRTYCGNTTFTLPYSGHEPILTYGSNRKKTSCYICTQRGEVSTHPEIKNHIKM